jgi:hypothetical protein
MHLFVRDFKEPFRIKLKQLKIHKKYNKVQLIIMLNENINDLKK